MFYKLLVIDARVAQLVEQRTENPRVGGSIPSPSTTLFLSTLAGVFFMPPRGSSGSRSK